MLSRRLIYSTLPTPYRGFSIALEKLDNYLSELKYLNPINNLVSIYGSKDSRDLRIGREITGREEDAYHNDEFSITDYHKAEFISETITASDLVELEKEIQKRHPSLKNYRVQWDLSLGNEFQVYFF